MKRSSANLTDRFIYQYLQALDCPRALSVWILYKSGEHKQVAELEFDPLVHNSYSKARDSLAATSLLAKARFLKTGNNLREKALSKFREAEASCKEANRRIFWPGNYSPVVAEGLSLARHKIHQILGRITSNREAFVDGCNWGPGASLSIKRREATYPKKFLEDREATPDLIRFISPWVGHAYPHWDCMSNVKETRANKIITVPKNAKTDRTIAIEPGLNIWFQKGIGTIIRRKLGRIGIDLNDQGKNQELALEASRGNSLSTIDFSAASDSISRAIVWELLPNDWYAVLDALRSKFATLDGTEFFYEKFSSMGNGYTFELESLIFYSLAWAACHISHQDTSFISIYGDDVVLPSKALDIFHQLCDFAGFKINKQKSYSSGYYRESCGSHYWDGQDIKPLFLKESIDGNEEELLKCANNLRRLAHRRNGYYGCDHRLKDCYATLRHALKGFPLISDGYGDAGIIENFDSPGVVFSRPKGQVEGFRVRVTLRRPHMVFIEHHGLLLTRLRESGGGSDISYGNRVPLPGRGRKIRKNLLIPRWYNLGPWC